MSNVIYLNEWRRERLAAIRQRDCLRRPRRGQVPGNKHLTAGLDLSAELRRLLNAPE